MLREASAVVDLTRVEVCRGLPTLSPDGRLFAKGSEGVRIARLAEDEFFVLILLLPEISPVRGRSPPFDFDFNLGSRKMDL